MNLRNIFANKPKENGPIKLELTEQEQNEIKIAIQLINQKEGDLILMKNGLQNIIRKMCDKYNLDYTKVGYNEGFLVDAK